MNNIFNDAEDIADKLSEAFTKIPDDLESNKDLQQGLREFGLDGTLVGDCPLRIIGCWNSTSSLVREARNRGLIHDQIENGLVLYAQQSAYITSEHRARSATIDQLTNNQLYKLDMHPVSSECDYSDDSDQDKMLIKYKQSSRPYSRTKITETALRLAQAEQSNKKNLANVLRTSLDHMMRANGQADPDRFHRDCLSDDKYPVHYSRGPNTGKLTSVNNNPITEDLLKQDKIQTGEHFSEYLNGQWIADAVAKKIPFLYTSVISPEELKIISDLKTDENPDRSLIKMLEQFGFEICFTETYQLVNEHYEQHQGTPEARRTSHLSGIFKPNGSGDIELTGTGKEIFYLLDLDYLPCLVEGRLFFSPNGDASLVKDSISAMHIHSLWSSIPIIIQMVPHVLHNIISALADSMADSMADCVAESYVNSTMLTQYKSPTHDKAIDIDTEDDRDEEFYKISNDRDSFLYLRA